MGPRSAVLRGGDACEHPLWGYEALSWAGKTHANTPTGAFGGAPYGATKRCLARKRRMRTLRLRLS
eukprot:1220391-Pyramimonas_sp.AAC.1